ncbi:MAG: pyridoxamine 5'-phosphate oxidase family protein [Pseudomonadota bacterium]
MATARRLNGTTQAFVERQKLFFVATAAPDGRVNVSPKGMESLRVMGENRIVWLNFSGSGNETAAHLLEANRMTLMWCAFEGDPMILRAYGSARTVHPGDDGWGEVASLFGDMSAKLSSRQIFDMQVDLVQSSCGTGVPLMDYAGERGENELLPFFEDMGADGVRDYWERKNTKSIDGRPTGIFDRET